MDWIEKLNKELEERRDRLSTPDAIEERKRKAAQYGGLVSKPSKEARKKLSDLGKQRKVTQEHKENLVKSKLRYKISKEQLLKAQSKHRFGKDIAKELGITFNTYKSIAEFHGVYKSLGEKNMGRVNGLKTSKPVLVWKYNKDTKSKGEFVGEWESGQQCSKDLGITRNSITLVCNKIHKQSKGYYIEWKK